MIASESGTNEKIDPKGKGYDIYNLCEDGVVDDDDDMMNSD